MNVEKPDAQKLLDREIRSVGELLAGLPAEKDQVEQLASSVPGRRHGGCVHHQYLSQYNDCAGSTIGSNIVKLMRSKGPFAGSVDLHNTHAEGINSCPAWRGQACRFESAGWRVYIGFP